MEIRDERHIGVDAGSGLVHTITVTAANAHDITQAAALIRDDDEVVDGDSGYLGKLFEQYGGMMRAKHLETENVFYAKRQKLIEDGYRVSGPILREFFSQNRPFLRFRKSLVVLPVLKRKLCCCCRRNLGA